MTRPDSKNQIAEMIRKRDSVHLRFGDGRPAVFHYLWLRDNCKTNLHPQTHERIFDLLSVAENISPKKAAVESGELRIEWKDGHLSRFSGEWLRANSYDDESLKERRPAPILWDAKTSLRRFSRDAILKDKASRLKWLRTLRDCGIAIIDGMPNRSGEAKRIALLISHLRRTNFGEEFNVISMPNPNNVAYTAVELLPHTDLPNREMPPGIQFLHCIANESAGGESIFTDGFAVAESIRRSDSAAFELLCRIPIPFRFHDGEWDIRWRSPTIILDDIGGYQEIRHHLALTSPLDSPPSVLRKVYAALRKFSALTRDAQFAISHRLQKGEMIAFHNRRILHGRKAFNPSAGRRRLQGCYVDWDELNSRIRVLERAENSAL